MPTEHDCVSQDAASIFLDNVGKKGIYGNDVVDRGSVIKSNGNRSFISPGPLPSGMLRDMHVYISAPIHIDDACRFIWLQIWRPDVHRSDQMKLVFEQLELIDIIQGEEGMQTVSYLH